DCSCDPPQGESVESRGHGTVPVSFHGVIPTKVGIQTESGDFRATAWIPAFFAGMTRCFRRRRATPSWFDRLTMRADAGSWLDRLTMRLMSVRGDRLAMKAPCRASDAVT